MLTEKSLAIWMNEHVNVGVHISMQKMSLPITNLSIYVVVQFYPWFKFYFLLFEAHYHTLPCPKTTENKI